MKRFRLRVGLGKRLGVLVIDSVVCVILYSLASSSNYLIGGMLFAKKWGPHGTNWSWEDPFPCLSRLVTVMVFVWGIAFVSEMYYGASIGMRSFCALCRFLGLSQRGVDTSCETKVCELKVLSKFTGHKAIWWQAMVRALAPMPLVILLFGLGLWWCGVDMPSWVSMTVFSVALCIASLQLILAAANDRRESIFDWLSRTVAIEFRERIKKSPAVRPLRPFPTPYVVGLPITGGDLFVGREEELGLLKDTLAKMNKGAIIVLGGAKRSGKSSLIAYIVSQQAAMAQSDPFWGGIVPLLVSMAQMPAGGDAGFYEVLTDKLLETVPEDKRARVPHHPGPQVEHNPRDFATIDRAQKAFTKALALVLAEHPDKMVLLMLDEAQILELKVEQKIMTPGVIPYLGLLKENEPRLSLIVAGPWDLKNQRFVYLDTLLVRASFALTLGHLSDAAARKLITEPVKDHMTYKPEAVEHMLRLTGNHPFYIQLVCNELVWRLGEKEGVTLEDVEAEAQSVAAQPPPMLPIFWAEASSKDRAVLAALARLSFDEEDYATAKEVWRQIRRKGQSPEISKPEVAPVLNDLVRRNILTIHSGRWYTFKVDILRMWIRASHLAA